MIEAKLLEISPQNEDKMGIDWSKTINASIFKEVLLPSGKPFQYTAEVPLTGGGVNFGTLNFGEYNAVLDFLKSNTNSKLVSNPRILAMDNQEATISVGTNVPIPQINRGVGGQGDVVTFQYRDVNISLRVTPHVAEDQTITLFVNPVIEEITGEVVAGENRAPVTSKREVETVVNLKSNDTMVIGGLIKESSIEQTDKVWLLGDMPLIGNLFRHKTKSVRQTDLLIFITPRLMTTP
jgi:general secretion pathway protein D